VLPIIYRSNTDDGLGGFILEGRNPSPGLAGWGLLFGLAIGQGEPT